jgi:hypothetical protein
MDLSSTIAAKSDQIDAIDLIAGPQTFTITGISKGSVEQPVNIQLAEFPRVWRPGLSMRRVLVYCWGPDGAAYVGRRVTLYCDPTIKFGPDVTGGTRISHLSHIDKPITIALPVTRGKVKPFRVQPLIEEARTAAATNTPATIGADAQKSLAIALDVAGHATKVAKLKFVSDVVKRQVASAAELTPAEAERVIEAAKPSDATEAEELGETPDDEGDDYLPMDGSEYDGEAGR